MATLLITTYREACAASGDFITGPDQTWLLGIGLLKSVASGADSLRIVRTLFQSPELRTAVANEAVSVTGTAGALNFGLRELIKTALKG